MQLLAYHPVGSPKQGNRSGEHHSPMTLHRRRRLVVSPSPLSLGLSVHEGGSGIRSPMGRWNFRRLGSTVTMGLNVAWLPRSLVTSSSGTGWACEMSKIEGSAPGKPVAVQIGPARHSQKSGEAGTTPTRVSIYIDENSAHVSLTPRLRCSCESFLLSPISMFPSALWPFQTSCGILPGGRRTQLATLSGHTAMSTLLH